MIRIVLLSLLLAGCTVRVELASKEDPSSVVEWRKQITQRVNEHETRLSTLEVPNDRTDRSAGNK